jgi:hypothetical protein
MVKGAPEIILSKCTSYIHGNNILPINLDFNVDQKRVYERLAGAHSRCGTIRVARAGTGRYYSSSLQSNDSVSGWHFPRPFTCR